jgi:cbb3-type cytochrome c oxidase subunit III
LATRRRAYGLAGLAFALLAAAGCGTGGLPASGADTTAGKRLFVQQCGSCHTLADAGTQGTIGPNLDDAFGPGREQGFEQSTIAAIVADQIKYPSPKKVTTVGAAMPADLVEGDNVDDVAEYVAAVAGVPVQGGGGGGGTITATDGKGIFTSAGCSSCHTLADAGATGTIGPSLDQAKPSKQLVIERVTNGQGAMPSFKDKLSTQQIDTVATYVSSVTR